MGLRPLQRDDSFKTSATTRHCQLFISQQLAIATEESNEEETSHALTINWVVGTRTKKEKVSPIEVSLMQRP